MSLLYTRPSAKTSSWHASATSRMAMGSVFCRAAQYTHAPTSSVVQSPSPQRPSLALTTSARASSAAFLVRRSCCAAKSTERLMLARCVDCSSRNIARATPGAEPGARARPERAAARCCPRVPPSCRKTPCAPSSSYCTEVVSARSDRTWPHAAQISHPRSNSCRTSASPHEGQRASPAASPLIAANAPRSAARAILFGDNESRAGWRAGQNFRGLRRHVGCA